MSIQVNVIMLGVQDVERAKTFYADGLGATVEQAYPGFVRLNLGESSSDLALYEWDAVAQDAGVSSEGSGFRGISFHHIVPSADAVTEAIDKAVKAGGTLVKAAEKAEWGGCDGYFADPDGYLWKVASAQ